MVRSAAWTAAFVMENSAWTDLSRIVGSVIGVTGSISLSVLVHCVMAPSVYDAMACWIPGNISSMTFLTSPLIVPPLAVAKDSLGLTMTWAGRCDDDSGFGPQDKLLVKLMLEFAVADRDPSE